MEDIRKVRRQVEDRLRKGSEGDIIKVAQLLGIYGCSDQGGHEYSSKTCPCCGAVFCWSCCGGTNVHEGGKYDEDYMFCPVCGRDYYSLKSSSVEFNRASDDKGAFWSMSVRIDGQDVPREVLTLYGSDLDGEWLSDIPLVHTKGV